MPQAQAVFSHHWISQQPLNGSTRLLTIYTSPEELRQAVVEFQSWCNHQRYHEALGNLRPLDVYFGRAEQIRKRRTDLQKQTLHQRWSHNRNHKLETVSAL